MNDYSLRGRCTKYVGEIMAALLIIQPLLDVLSYFVAAGAGNNVFTTVLRTILLITVSLFGMFISDNRKYYYIMYFVIVSFWLVHMANCFRIGYNDPLGDAGEYFKLIQFPLWTLTFITFFRKRADLDLAVTGVLAANFGIIVLIILLSFLFQNPVYTYDFPDRNVQIGILGWFGVANSQSAIVSILAMPTLLWAFYKDKLWLFCVASALTFGLLYFTGTRLAYYSGIIIAICFLVLIVIKRESLYYCIPLLLVLAMFIGLKGFSPMAERQDLTADSYAIYQEKTDKVMGKDKDFKYHDGEEIPESIRRKIKKVYTDVYSGDGVYGNPLLGDLIDRFGVDTVMEKYNYSIAPEVLYNVRTKRMKTVELIWDEQDLITKLFGFEYSEVIINNRVFDPENDFPVLLYYYGYVGAGLYIIFVAYFFFISVIGFLRELFDFITMSFGTAMVMYILGLASAQFSGQVLRKPSVTVYISLAAALIYVAVYRPIEPKYYASYAKKSRVEIKHIS